MVAAMLTVATTTGCGDEATISGSGATTTIAPHDIEGEVIIEFMYERASPCKGESDGINIETGDLRAGAPVVLRDEAGRVIASTELPKGELRDDPRYSDSSRNCVFPFRLEDVPMAAFYQLEVGDGRVTTIQRAELEEDEFQVTVTI